MACYEYFRCFDIVDISQQYVRQQHIDYIMTGLKVRQSKKDKKLLVEESLFMVQFYELFSVVSLKELFLMIF